MNAQERHTLEKILKMCSNPCSPGSAYDGNFQPIEVKKLVRGIDNNRLLDNEAYKAGYRYAAEQFATYIKLILLDGTKLDQLRFAGRPGKGVAK